MIKIDLHMHTGDDPKDGLRYPATALIEKAAALGYGAIAITLHGKVFDDERVFAFAREKNVLLIPAVEWRIQGGDVLLYNVTESDVAGVRTFDDLRALRRRRGDELLVIAPHPFYPAGHSLNRLLEPNMDVFDAIEYCYMHLTWLNPNQRAVRLAEKYHKPMVANSDTHNLWMFGRHFTLVDAEPEMRSIFQAIRAGRVERCSPPVTIRECLRFFLFDPLLRRPGKIVASFDGQATK